MLYLFMPFVSHFASLEMQPRIEGSVAGGTMGHILSHSNFIYVVNLLNISPLLVLSHKFVVGIAPTAPIRSGSGM